MGNPDAKESRGSWKWKLLALGASVILGLAAGEILVRAIGFAPSISRINPEMKNTVFRVSKNPLLGYVFKENYRDEKADLWTSYPYINAHGFRDIERDYRKPEGTKRIILLGDSVVAGHINIRSIEDTISRQLEKSLAPQNVEVINMGVTGYCTLGEVELLRERGLRYDPDLVVLCFVGANDYADLNMELGYVTPSRPVQLMFIYSHLFRYLGVKYNLYNLGLIHGVNDIAGEWIGRLHTTQRKYDILESQNASAGTIRDHLAAIEKFKKNPYESNVHVGLRMLKEMSEEHGFGVIIGIWPHFEGDEITDPELYGATLSKVILKPELGGLTIEKLALEHQIPFFRFSQFFAKDYLERQARTAGAIGTPTEIYVEGEAMHPNPVGAGVAAKAVQSILESNPGLLE